MSDSTIPSPARPDELQDWLNQYLYHPLSRRLAHSLVPTPVTPNAVSVFGGFLVFLAGCLYTQSQAPLIVAIALVLHMAWHVVDGADGDLARMTGRAGPAGEVVDGLSDYASHIIVYFMLGYLLERQVGDWAFALLWAAGLSRIAQTNHYEVRRRQYQFWVYDRAWLRNEPFHSQGGAGRILEWIARFYLRLAQLFEGKASAIEAVHAAAQSSPANAASFRASARRHLQPFLAPLGMLGSNHRTLVLGASMFAGTPLYFFLYEAVLLNLVLAWSLIVHAAAGKRIARDMG